MTAARIRRAIKRTQGFRDWFKRTVPKKAVELDVILDDPTQYGKDVTEVAKSKPAGKLISCGTVGCVLGWLRVYPPLRRRLHEDVSPYDYIGVWEVGDDSIFDGLRPEESENQKVAAITRLNRHIKDLRQVLKEVA